MPKDLQPHIGIFGRRNYGKSSLVNVLIGQEISIVSEIAGTTTDPVKKSIEIDGIGPVVLIDTAGIDDMGDLGIKRIKKTEEVLKTIDLAIVLVINNTISDFEIKLVTKLKEFEVPFFFVHHKSDLFKLELKFKNKVENEFNTDILDFSSLKHTDISPLKSLIKKAIPESAYQVNSMLNELIQQNDIILLIVPIDTEAPEGRLILPQVQVIRDVLDNSCVAVVLKESEVELFLKNTGIKPKLAITDSSIFKKADLLVPHDIPLTGFSVLLAKYKGPFPQYISGTPYISKLKDDDRVLILESCTHHVTCDDIGRTKLPGWISQYTGKKLDFDIVAGLSKINDDVNKYALIIQCGGCMITRKQIYNRLKPFIDAGIHVTNYGMVIAYMQGIYNRAIQPFEKS